MADAGGPLAVANPPRDGVIAVLDKVTLGSAWTLVAWVSADGSICYGDVTASQPQGTLTCTGSPDGYLARGSPSLFLKPVLVPVAGAIFGIGFTRGPISTVAVTVFGQRTTAKVTDLSGGASPTGVYALPVPMQYDRLQSGQAGTGQVGWSDISAVTGYAGHKVIAQLR